MRKIHINSNTIKSNAKHGTNKPPITVRKGTKVETYAHEVVVNGPCRIIYRPNDPLSCGAKVWIETASEVVPILLDEIQDFALDATQAK